MGNLLDLKTLVDEAGIAPKYFLSIASYLDTLRDKHEETYYHVLRVGRLAAIIADYANIPGVTPKMMMWAGLLHDIGKAYIDLNVLNKTEKFDDDDRAAMEPHVIYGWMILKKVHEHTAHVIVRHHQYGKHPYPKRLPPLPDHLEPKQNTIEAAARLLALADYYDALTTRKNDRNEGLATAEGLRELYLRENPGFEALVSKLEAAGVMNFEAACES